MSKTIYNKIIAKLERLDEYLKYLTELKKISKKHFIADFHYYGLAERYLQLAIEVILDTCKLVIISENLKKPEDNADMFVILKENKIISTKIATSFMGVSGFRNILVHDYEKIDREIVFHKIQKNLIDFKLFKKAVLKFLSE